MKQYNGVVASLSLKKQMISEAIEYYIYSMQKDNCNQASIDAYTYLLMEIEQSET